MADARVAELAALSGEKLVDLLRTTYRRADFEAVARVLKARDRRFAEAKAALSDIDALRKKHDAILSPRRRPRVEAVEGTAPLLGIASENPMRRDEPRVEELEDAPLSPPLKRPRQCETSAFESGKMDGQGRSNSVGTLGNNRQKSSPAKSVHSVAPKERTGQLAGGSTTPEDPKQGRRAVEPEKWGGGMTRTAPLLSPGRSVPPKGSSQSHHGRGRPGTGKKQSSSSDGILGPPPKWNGKITRTPMVESSYRSANKDAWSAMSPCRQTEGSRMIAKGGNPTGETRMVAASPSLSIRSLSAQELQAYCLKPGRTPPASSMQIETQNFRDLAKGGNGLSMKRADVSSKETGGWGLSNIQKYRENSNDNTNATSVQLI